MTWSFRVTVQHSLQWTLTGDWPCPEIQPSTYRALAYLWRHCFIRNYFV